MSKKYLDQTGLAYFASKIKTALAGKASTGHGHDAATTSAAGFMSTSDKSKLDGISAGANAYTHPSYTARTGKPTANATPAFGGTFTVSQITSDATGHVTGATDRTVKIPNTAATQNAAGLMSAADKKKLDGIVTNLVNGSAEGSLRSVGAKEEGSDYEMGMYASATGSNTVASEYASHAEGENTTASGSSGHAEGYDTTASGYAAHSEGHATEASGYATHAEGYDTTASGGYSHSEGRGTIASRKFQHVQGAYNIADTTGSNTSALGAFAHIVGNGDSDTARSNAHTIDWDGNAWFAGDVYVGSTSGTNKDSGSKKLLKEGDVSIPVTSVNNKTGAVTLTASDVGARASTWTPSASDVGAVPTSRTVNGKVLSSDITLSASDVGAASTATYTVSVDTSWTANSAGGFYKTVTVSGMLATDNPIADIVLGSDVAANALYLEAWALVTRITTTANSITLYANGEAPTTAFTIQLKVVR